MNKKTLLLIFSLFLATTIIAQPSSSAIIKRLTHAGVTKVEVVKTVKEWKDGKYIYVAYANVIKAVAPEKVFGLKGVTLVIATIAYYDLGASLPYQVLGSESNGEYRGINLPIPSNAELTKYATDAAQISPDKFFMQAYSIIAVEKITVTNPKAEWLHPGKLKFEATMIYVDRLTKETFQRIQAPCIIELHRDALNAPWYLGKAAADRMQERYTGDIIHAVDAPQWANLPSLSDRVAENANKEKITAMGFATPPVFVSGKELALHINEKLHSLSKEQFAEYMKLLLHSSLRQAGTASTPNGNGQNLIDNVVRVAYDGWGKYKDQYCTVPDKFETVGLTTYWFNKRLDRKCDVSAKKDGDTYAIENIHIFLDKKQEDDAAFKAITCGSATTIITPVISSTITSTFKKGEKVQVEENGKWYPATVLDTRPGEWYIHYDGYSSQYDLWVGPERIKK
jgi:RNA binding activity-knot of a chromodomain